MSSLKYLVISLFMTMLLTGNGCLAERGRGGYDVPRAGIGAAADHEPSASAHVTAPAVITGIELQLIAEGFTSPVALVPSPDETGRLFVVDQAGMIYVIVDGKVRDEPFLDIRSRMVTLDTAFDERGLLDMEFHPDFRQNGRFFVYYSAPLREGGPEAWNHTSRVSEFRVSDSDPDQADAASERIILQVDQPYSIHNAGQLLFGPDGLLYISLGDGGLRENGQDVNTLLGSILRICVEAGEPYSIPVDNPFLAEEGRGEIYAIGFRNPYRMSFDAGGQRELFVGDVGEMLREEVNIVAKGGNYGWSAKEGSTCFNPDDPSRPLPQCSDTDAAGRSYIDPIIEYPHTDSGGVYGTAVIGGYIYRGTAIPGLAGQYVFGDYTTYPGRDQPDGRLFAAVRGPDDEPAWTVRELQVTNNDNLKLDSDLRGFGQDADKELYVLVADTPGPEGETGKVYKILPPSA